MIRASSRRPGVVCIHANASSSAQWRRLAELLAPEFRVVTPDSAQNRERLADEVALLEPAFALVGHSYGAAVALIAALSYPDRVHALALYEPTLFSLLDKPIEAEGIRQVVTDAGAALDAGNADGAAERFIDYWMEPGAWLRTPESRKPAIVASIANVRRWGQALFSEPTPLAAFRSLDIPVLYMIGKRTTASARGVARLLSATLPRVEVVEFADAGHMGPLTHADAVNATIRQFLRRSAAATGSASRTALRASA
jgi:pimeloyl-ACP methyl ester carboxylesterase